MNLKTLINNTPLLFPTTRLDVIHNKAYSLVDKKKKREKNDIVYTLHIKSPNKTYETRIRFLDVKENEIPHTSGNVRVFCSCKAFAFTLEYTLSKVNALDGVLTVKNIAAKEKNPLDIPALCKHLYGTVVLLIKKREVINK